jgi:hypothetical protein
VGSDEASARSSSSGTRVSWSGTSTVATASGAEKRVRARERRKEEESDFASSLGHSGEGIRVTRQLEAAHVAGGHRWRTVTVCGAQLNFKFPMIFTHLNFEI